jgi:hypothetical protein
VATNVRGWTHPTLRASNRRIGFRLNPPSEVKRLMKNRMNALLLTAALTGLIGGTSVAAQTANHAAKTSSAKVAKSGMMLAGYDNPPAKHSCKGKNSCKGTGGCSTGDQGCKGKNSCKGKGGCATDGSTPPKFA